jgi:hypothetical protein
LNDHFFLDWDPKDESPEDEKQWEDDWDDEDVDDDFTKQLRYIYIIKLIF